MKRDNTTHQAVLERLSKQKNETHPYDYIILSNEENLEIPQILKIHNQLLDISNQT